MENELKARNVLLQEIMKEINEVPIIYLRTLYALIHSFKETMPTPEKIQKDASDDFDWDALLEEIYKNRKLNTARFDERVSVLFEE